MMFSSLMVVVMLQMLLLQTSAADVSLSIEPAQIQVPSSPPLDVNCTASFSGDSAIANIISLAVSRVTNTKLDLAIITIFSDHQVNVISSEGITADGVINPGGQSYIHLHWDYPTDTQEGTYQCSARGMDPLGHIVVSTDVAVVTIKQVDMLDLLKKLQEMSRYTEELEERLVQNENYAKEPEEMLSVKDDYIIDLEQNVSVAQPFCRFIDPPLIYQNAKYVVSQLPFTDFNNSIDVCKAIRGQLAEINDWEEYYAIQNYLRTLSGVELVYVGGNYKGNAYDKRWVLPSSGEELPVVDWAVVPPVPYEDRCLCLYSEEDWKMTPDFCQMYGWGGGYPEVRYMCELYNY